ncbi:nuclear transport factor 2 family protein [Massilia sp. W12]|uniref:nuclear transport factor 2 family protein n=1 Tax=Massilia sp. W12 TaxID=3126507 RepID=UPI0030D3740C
MFLSHPISAALPRLLSACLLALLMSAQTGYAQTAAQAPDGSNSDAARAYFAQSEQSKQIGEAYFNAYMKMDWDKLGTLLGETANFSDPTARLVFGRVDVTGKEAILRYFRTSYAGLTLKFLPTRKLYSGHFAIFEGMLDWTYPTPQGVQRVIMPFVNVLQIENGLVVKHLDLADYHPYYGVDG